MCLQTDDEGISVGGENMRIVDSILPCLSLSTSLDNFGYGPILANEEIIQLRPLWIRDDHLSQSMTSMFFFLLFFWLIYPALKPDFTSSNY